MLRGLSRDPSARFESMDALLAELRPGGVEATAAAPAAASGSGKPWVWPVVGAIAGSLVLLVGGGGILAGVLIGRGDRDAAVSPAAPVGPVERGVHAEGPHGLRATPEDKPEPASPTVPAASAPDAGTAVAGRPAKRPRNPSRDPDPDPDPTPDPTPDPDPTRTTTVRRQLLVASTRNIYTHGEVGRAAARLNVARCFPEEWQPHGHATSCFVTVEISAEGNPMFVTIDRDDVPGSTADCILRTLMVDLELPVPESGRGGLIDLHIPLHAHSYR
jgi:hypothetical protein